MRDINLFWAYFCFFTQWKRQKTSEDTEDMEAE